MQHSSQRFLAADAYPASSERLFVPFSFSLVCGSSFLHDYGSLQPDDCPSHAEWSGHHLATVLSTSIPPMRKVSEELDLQSSGQRAAWCLRQGDEACPRTWQQHLAGAVWSQVNYTKLACLTTIHDSSSTDFMHAWGQCALLTLLTTCSHNHGPAMAQRSLPRQLLVEQYLWAHAP